jgi:hypothetical protein
MLALMWLVAGAAVYLLTRQPEYWLLPVAWQVRVAPFPLQQVYMAFPTFAQTVALALVSVWMLGAVKEGAAAVCGAWMMLEVGYQYAQRSDVSAWIIPRLPWFFRDVWPLNYATNFLGRGTFDGNNVLAAALGGIIAYMVVINSRNRMRRRATT